MTRKDRTDCREIARSMTLGPDSGPSKPYTAFRLAEKHFKDRARLGYQPSLRGCSGARPAVDLSRPEKEQDDPVWLAGWWGPEGQSIKKGKERARGERPELGFDGRWVDCNGRRGFVVAEGCILIPLYLDEDEQLGLLEEALSEYTLPPNPLNLSTHYELPPNLFKLYAEDSDQLIPTLASKQLLQPRNGSENASGQSEGSSPSSNEPWIGRKTVDTPPGHVIGYQEILSKNKEWVVNPPSDKLGAKTARELMKEIRWANLGWVYQWSMKSYDFRPDTPISFPPRLAEMCSDVVRNIPWDEIYRDVNDPPDGFRDWARDYVPDTGIVNFYQMNDTLMGHVDRAELDPARPLVSISLGHTAIFLLGSSSRDASPLPIILRSGDVLVMSGRGRQNYHGIPRIMEGTLPLLFGASDDDSTTRAAAKRWIGIGRININARQVFPPGFQRPNA